MFKHLLVPLDLVDHETALDAVLALARGRETRVTLLHVIEEIAGLEDDEELRSFYRRLEKKAATSLAQAVRRLEEAEVAAEAVTTYGPRAPEIVRAALRRGVDLIVLESRPVDRDIVEKGWPTVSHQVALTSPVPVLLAR